MNQATAPDLIMTTIALVVNEPTSPPRVSEADLRSLLRPPLVIGQAAIGESVVSSNRDQMEVHFGPTKINVRDLSGNIDFANSRIPELVHAFLNRYNTTIRSYGVNFVVTVDMNDPEVWIAKNLLNVALSQKTGKVLRRGRAHISLGADPKTWNVQFQRNADGKLEINFNASEEATELPAFEMLQAELSEQYQGFRKLIGSLGL